MPEWSCKGCGTTNRATATLGCSTCSNRVGKRRTRHAICPDCEGPMVKGHAHCHQCECKARRERTHCKRGHLWNEDNTYRSPSGHRECRICRNDTRRPWTRWFKRAGIAR